MNTMNASQTNNRTNTSVVIMIAACAALALLVLGGALYAQSQQDRSSNAMLTYCDQPRTSWLSLPAQVQRELAQNCSAQATTEAK